MRSVRSKVQGFIFKVSDNLNIFKGHQFSLMILKAKRNYWTFRFQKWIFLSSFSQFKVEKQIWEFFFLILIDSFEQRKAYQSSFWVCVPLFRGIFDTGSKQIRTGRLWNWKRLKVVVTKITFPNKLEKRKEEPKNAAADDEAMEENAPFCVVTHVKNTLHPFFSQIEVCIEQSATVKSTETYSHNSYILMDLKGAISVYHEVLSCKDYDCIS